MLYHYTGAGGLKGIFDSNTLWATDAEFLNDARELQFGRDEMLAVLAEYAEELFPAARPFDGGEQYSRAEVVRSAIAYLLDTGGRQQGDGVYVSCFCEAGDLLSQWRGYGAGGGYALGFDVGALRDITAIPTTLRQTDGHGPGTLVAAPDQMHLRPTLMQVHYGPEAITDVVATVRQQIAPLPTGHPGAHGWAQAVTLAIPALASIKHPAFSEEREWRLIIADTGAAGPARFRLGPLGLVPYVEVPIDLSVALREVIVGPSPYPELHKLAVTRLLSNAGLHNVPLRLSDVPYRT